MTLQCLRRDAWNVHHYDATDGTRFVLSAERSGTWAFTFLERLAQARHYRGQGARHLVRKTRRTMKRRTFRQRRYLKVSRVWKPEKRKRKSMEKTLYWLSSGNPSFLTFIKNISADDERRQWQSPTKYPYSCIWRHTFTKSLELLNLTL